MTRAISLDPLLLALLTVTTPGGSLQAAPHILEDKFGTGFPFDGSLDGISIHRSTLTPAQLSFNTDYASVQPSAIGALAGDYTTAPCNRGQPVRITDLRTTATLNDGTISARLETSNDEFKTIDAAGRLELHSGEPTLTLRRLPAARLARVVFRLATHAGARNSPVLSAAELTAEPGRP